MFHIGFGLKPAWLSVLSLEESVLQNITVDGVAVRAEYSVTVHADFFLSEKMCLTSHCCINYIYISLVCL